MRFKIGLNPMQVKLIRKFMFKIIGNSFWLFFILSCSQKPSRERFPGPTGRTTSLQQAQATKEVLGGFDPQSRKQQEDEAIHGIVNIKAGLKIPEKKHMIFISARPIGGGGPPLAVLRLTPRKLPFRFRLSQENVMMQGTRLEGFVDLNVRVIQQKEDGSFDPLARQPGDLYGTLPVKVGAKNVQIVLSEVIKK
jgi:hypothetical protein